MIGTTFLSIYNNLDLYSKRGISSPHHLLHLFRIVGTSFCFYFLLNVERDLGDNQTSCSSFKVNIIHSSNEGAISMNEIMIAYSCKKLFEGQ